MDINSITEGELTMRDLSEIRVDIDRIDTEIKNKLMERLDYSHEVVLSKIRDKNYVINRPDREAAMLERLGKDIPKDRKNGYLAVVRKITETSRMYQYGILFDQVPELFEALTKDIDLTVPTDVVSVRLLRRNIPNSMSEILSMIGDYGFDMEEMQLLSYSEDHAYVYFRLTIQGDIRETRMQKLLLQLSMESEEFTIMKRERIDC